MEKEIPKRDVLREIADTLQSIHKTLVGIHEEFITLNENMGGHVIWKHPREPRP